MTDFAARVRCVRMKEGATVHVLHTPRNYINESGNAENLIGKVLQHAKIVAGYDEPASRLDGFVVVGFFDDGSSSVGYRIPARIPNALLPSYIAELLRRDAVTSRECARVFDDKFEWRDGR